MGHACWIVAITGIAAVGCKGTIATHGADSGAAPDSGTSPFDAASADASSPADAGTSKADGGVTADAGGTPPTPQLWYWHHSYLAASNAQEPARSEAIIDQAVDAGYTGLAFWDSSLSFAAKPGWDLSKMTTVVNYALSKGLRVLPGTAPFGYSNDMLQTDPNLAEGQHVVGTRFQVSGGQLQIVNSLPPLVNGGFESGKAGWFGTADPRVSVDNTVAHSGTSSALIQGSATATDNARLSQAFTVTPWRLYHIQFWYQTAGLSGNNPQFEVLDFTTTPGTTFTRFSGSVQPAATQSWTVVDFDFNSRESTSVSLYLGIWGGNQGNLWIDDISAEEMALVNVLRRSGTPLSVYDPTTSTAYVEGQDFGTISDPALAASPGNYDNWHTPPSVTVPAGSNLTAGQTVAIDHYVIVPVWGGQVGMCLSDPAVQQWIAADVTALDPVFPKDSGFFVGYDEMRHMNSCGLCASKAMTAGQLLAWNVGQTVQTIDAIRPGSQIYFWSDMFDPNHNAVDNYYFVQGSISGSWAGLPSDAVIMNWHLGALASSFGFFAGKTSPSQTNQFRQIIAGYYDSGNGATSAQNEISAVIGIPGLIGFMYTSWVDDYTQLGPYAQTVRSQWAAYRSSVP